MVAWLFDNRPHEWVFDHRRPPGWYPHPAGDDLWAYWSGLTWLSQPASRSPRVMASTFMSGHPIMAFLAAITLMMYLSVYITVVVTVATHAVIRVAGF